MASRPRRGRLLGRRSPAGATPSSPAPLRVAPHARLAASLADASASALGSALGSGSTSALGSAAEDWRAALAMLASGEVDVHTGNDWALQYACMYAPSEVVARLLALGADPCVRDKPESTADEDARVGSMPLTLACSRGDVAIVDLLLDAGAAPNPFTLLAACASDRADVVARLLRSRRTSLRHLQTATALVCACEAGFVAVVEQLLAAGAIPDDCTSDGKRPLVAASARCHVAVVRRLLTADPMLPASASGRQALRAAARGGHLDVVDCLLGAGVVDVDTPEDDVAVRQHHESDRSSESTPALEMSALEAACSEGHDTIATRLLAARSYALGTLRNALQEAVLEQHEETVDLLLSHADGVADGLHGLVAAAILSENAALVARLLEAVPDAGAAVPVAVLERVVAFGDTPVLEVLVRGGVRVTGTLGTAALTLACDECDDTAVVDRLVDADPSLLVACRGLLLSWACGRGDLAWVERVLAAGGVRGPQLANALSSACKNGRVAVVERLLAMGISARLCTDDAFAEACWGGHLAVVDVLLQAGLNRRGCADAGLVEAVRGGQTEAVARLLAAGADVHTDNDAPLQMAVITGSVDLVRMLLDHGADVHAESDATLVKAIVRQREPVVRCLLDAGADLHANDGEALRYACQMRDMAVVRCLLSAGADVHVGEDAPLRDASQSGSTAVVKLLLQAGANVHAQDDMPLRVASARGHEAVVALLLRAGANVHAGDDEALLNARKRGSAAVERLLLDAGADPRAELNYAVRIASRAGFGLETLRLLAEGASPHSVEWGTLPRLVSLRALLYVPRDTVRSLTDPAAVQLWAGTLLRPTARLLRALGRARSRLDRPPTEPLGDRAPTRERMIAHLQTGGVRFAREYWAEGLPIFFPGFSAELGPVPECFIMAGSSVGADRA